MIPKSKIGIAKKLEINLQMFLLEFDVSDIYVAPPPDMITFLQEERRLEQQLYRQSICSESDSNHETAESRDSGVELDRGHVDDICWSKQPLSPDVLSEPHSRQNSEVCKLT